MKLLSLNLQDFQGLRRFSLNADGRNVSVYGTNGTGKTTVANAISWLLFDKPYTGEKNYSPKTTDEDGNDLHHLDHRAEAVLERDDGSRLTIARVFHEVWKKKRGSAAEEFSGHVTDAYIDGVPVSAKEYRAILDELCPPEKAKILTSPRYFAKDLHWEERRSTLLEMCGDVSDAEVINSHKDLFPLWDYLRKPGTMDQFYTVSEFMRIAASRKAELNRDLAILPARIDETMRSIPDISELPPENELEQRIGAMEQKKMSLMQQAAAVTIDEQAQVLRQQLGDLDARIAEARAAYLQAASFRNQTANEAIDAAGRDVSAAYADMSVAKQRIVDIEKEIERLEADRMELLRQHAEVKSRAWDGDTVCAACGQPLPEEKIEEAKARFNQQRSRELAAINEKGQLCSKTVIEAKRDELEQQQTAFEEAERRKNAAEAELAEAKAAVVTVEPFESTAEYAALAAQRAALAAQVNDGSTTMASQRAALQDQIDAITADIGKDQEAKLLHVTARKRRERLAELEEQEKRTAQEYEKFDRGVFLCEEFTRAKVSMLDERINSRFHAVRFRLFKQQINGGLSDCCDVLCPTSTGLVPYDSANNAAQVNAGIEIAAALGRHWGVSMPIIIDNAESVVSLIETEAQTIRLVVSEADTRLRTEFDEEKMSRQGVA